MILLILREVRFTKLVEVVDGFVGVIYFCKRIHVNINDLGSFELGIQFELALSIFKLC